jgi:hypothetical protein
MEKQYKVKWNYRSSLGGPFVKDTVVMLDDELAKSMNVDSPGVLQEVKKKSGGKKDEEKSEEKKDGILDKINRAIKGPENANVTKTEPTQEVIDKTVFKAVKDEKK